ncbi:tetratricopeptide repeat protein [Actinosynnema sp. NPDC023658]|uniref:tetratricopeptide repeat protein n=1 Tax=Actinosynnema sp. NPDC023658 TaxID=3155465 RepID=UPI00340DD951
MYVVYAEGEEAQAELLAQPLREAGYDVTHNGTVVVGESLIASAMRAVTGGTPVVLCATARASGSAWAHQIVNAGHSGGRIQVFVVQMESQAYVEHLALRNKVARYCDDSAAAVRDLLAALAKHFPPTGSSAPVQAEWISERMDAPLGRNALDIEAVQRFRDELRPEVTARHPATLEPWEFLERAGLAVAGELTVTGVLLFGRNPTAVLPAAAVKCVRYHGMDRSALRYTETFEGVVPDQITLARDFVARHVRRGELPSRDQVRSVDVYDYPMIAVREIIANALVHRDYSTTDICVHIRLFHDRLEISSPGSWLGRNIADGAELSLAELEGQSIKRNFRLAHVLSWVRLVEGEGSGIPTSLRDCAQTQSEPPTVRYDQSVVTITLKPRSSGSIALHTHDGTAYQQFNVVTPSREVAWPVRVGVPPQVVEHFQDRSAMTQISETLSIEKDTAMAGISPASAVVVSGLGGVGKSQLAARYAWSLWAEPKVDVAVWVSAVSRDAVVTAFANTAKRVLHEQDSEVFGRTPEFAAESLLEWLASTGRRWLVVLDDVQNPADLMGLWPPQSDTGQFVVTTRRRDAQLHAGRRMIELNVFTRDEAVAYLADMLTNTTDDADRDQLESLAEELGRLPLALSQAAAYLIDHPLLTIADYRAMLADRRRTLAELMPAESELFVERQQTLAATWSLSIERADQADGATRPSGAGLARPLLEIASLLDPNGTPLDVFTTWPVLQHLATCVDREVGSDDVRDGLTRLHRFNLITLTPDLPVRGVAVHALVQRAVRDTITADRNHDLAHVVADALLEAWPEIDSQQPALTQALRSCANTLHTWTVPSLWYSRGHLLLFRVGRSAGESGQPTTATTYFQRLQDQAITYLGPDHPDTLTTRNDLAYWRGHAGDAVGAAEALAELLTDRLRVLGPDHPDTLTTRNDLANVYESAGDAGRAIPLYEATLTDAKRVLGPDHPTTRKIRSNLENVRSS